LSSLFHSLSSSPWSVFTSPYYFRLPSSFPVLILFAFFSYILFSSSPRLFIQFLLIHPRLSLPLYFIFLL
jgi:hypothetical protein